MSDPWAKDLAAKIAAGDLSTEKTNERAVRIVKYAERAREQAAESLFQLFTARIDAVERYLKRSEGGGFWQRWRKSSPPLLTYIVDHNVSMRFQLHEAWGSRLVIDFLRGQQPKLTVDVATAELIQGEYLPIFRNSGAIAGAQLWRQRSVEGKHPEMIARLLLLLSAAAIDEGLTADEAVSWVYEDDLRPFTAATIESLIEQLIATA
ncbi:MAG: hypothetical protein AB1489_26570 [Acidobacteriota bacterium]